jgi:hypothetical protein
MITALFGEWARPTTMPPFTNLAEALDALYSTTAVARESAKIPGGRA